MKQLYFKLANVNLIVNSKFQPTYGQMLHHA
jgi:hypothetical protein